jgi:hypothetical protein
MRIEARRSEKKFFFYVGTAPLWVRGCVRARIHPRKCIPKKISQIVYIVKKFGVYSIRVRIHTETCSPEKISCIYYNVKGFWVRSSIPVRIPLEVSYPRGKIFVYVGAGFIWVRIVVVD